MNQETSQPVNSAIDHRLVQRINDLCGRRYALRYLETVGRDDIRSPEEIAAEGGYERDYDLMAEHFGDLVAEWFALDTVNVDAWETEAEEEYGGLLDRLVSGSDGESLVDRADHELVRAINDVAGRIYALRHLETIGFSSKIGAKGAVGVSDDANYDSVAVAKEFRSAFEAFREDSDGYGEEWEARLERDYGSVLDAILLETYPINPTLLPEVDKPDKPADLICAVAGALDRRKKDRAPTELDDNCPYNAVRLYEACQDRGIQAHVIRGAINREDTPRPEEIDDIGEYGGGHWWVEAFVDDSWYTVDLYPIGPQFRNHYQPIICRERPESYVPFEINPGHMSQFTEKNPLL